MGKRHLDLPANNMRDPKLQQLVKTRITPMHQGILLASTPGF